MIIKHTEFGKTKMVCVDLHNMSEGEIPEKVLWVERSEDMYALMSKEYKDKKVAIVHRRDWIKANEI